MKIPLLPFKRSGQEGQSTVEVLIASAVLAVAVQAAVLVVRTASRLNVDNRDKAFAAEKAMQMLEELRGLVLDDVIDIKNLENAYADGRGGAPGYVPNYKFTLTTKQDVTTPGGVLAPDYQTATHPLSANPIRNKGYVFVRHVDVVGNTIDPNTRKVYVRVFYAAPNPGNASPSTPSAKATNAVPLAEVFGIVRSLGAVDQPSQVLDVHLVALESVPGWWSRTSNLIPLMQSSLVSLQARNPGLKIRAHWIRRMSYGRDLEYTPEINSSVRADSSGAFKKAYVYPGLVQYDDSDDFYYSPDWFKARVNIDGAIKNVEEGYPIADQFNHAMRYPDEERLYKILCTIAANRGSAPPEMSLRMLLEKMSANDPSLRNAIVINLHGEMVPAVPLRNYSDAAKDPQAYTSRGGTLVDRAWRAVTHSERLHYDTTVAGQADQSVNVYAYDMNPPADPITAADEDDIIDSVTVFIPGADLSNLKGVERVQGNSRVPYYRFAYNSANWTNSGSTIQDGPAAASSAWVADAFTPAGRSSGLRIRLHGVTPTARAYNGPVYVP
jgi:hypothetical protein